MTKKRILLSTEVYRQDSLFLVQEFDEALARGDWRELARIFGLATGLFRELLKALKSKYGNRPQMSAKKRHSWEGWLPAEVMGDLRNAKEIQEDWINRVKEKVPRLSAKAQREARSALRKVEQDLRARVRDGRKWINKRWPGWWTPQVESDFSDWL
jgi:hypothetical protein